MAEKQMNAVLRLRRDSENNFKRSNIVLQSGEAAVVYTPFQGTRIKIGDGQTAFNDLAYENFGLMARGFKSQDIFLDIDNQTVINPNDHILFLDLNSGFIYYWDYNNNEYKYVSGSIVPTATDAVEGIMKLYDTVNGNNTDGAITQRAAKNAFSAVQTAANNIEYTVNVDEEMLIPNFDPLQTLNLFSGN